MAIAPLKKSRWHEAVTKISEFDTKSAAKHVRHLVIRFGSWVGLILLAVTYTAVSLVHFHLLPESWKVFPNEQLPAMTIVVALLFVVSEQVKEYSSEQVKGIYKLERSVESLAHRVENFGSQLIPQLMLSQCVQKLQESLNGVPSREIVSIRHIALDMEYAWLLLQEKIFEQLRLTRRCKVSYQLLLVSDDITPPANELPELQAEIKEMSERAGRRLKRIKSYFESTKSQLNHVSVEIRTYTSLPTLHGISADKPVPLHHVAFCGWRGSEPSTYHWGEGHYYQIKERPDTSTSLGDIVSMFDKSFENLWINGTQVYKC